MEVKGNLKHPFAPPRKNTQGKGSGVRVNVSAPLSSIIAAKLPLANLTPREAVVRLGNIRRMKNLPVPEGMRSSVVKGLAVSPRRYDPVEKRFVGPHGKIDSMGPSTGEVVNMTRDRVVATLERSRERKVSIQVEDINLPVRGKVVSATGASVTLLRVVNLIPKVDVPPVKHIPPTTVEPRAYDWRTRRAMYWV